MLCKTTTITVEEEVFASTVLSFILANTALPKTIVATAKTMLSSWEGDGKIEVALHEHEDGKPSFDIKWTTTGFAKQFEFTHYLPDENGRTYTENFAVESKHSGNKLGARYVVYGS